MTLDTIDLGYLGLARAAAAFVVSASDGATLVECGPAACVERVRDHLRSRGLRLRRIVLTHIHLDHAGAAGHLVREGGAEPPRVFVHPFGTRHLIDPAKLIASSRRVHGDAFDRYYGAPLPCPAESVVAVADGGEVELGADELGRHITATAIATPGHARHHHAWILRGSGPSVVFAGDVAAMLVPASSFVSVPMPPPEFDLASWRRSLARLEDSRADRLLLTHFGAVADVARHLSEVRRRLDEECEFAAALVRSGLDEAAAVNRYLAWLWPQARSAGVDEARLRTFLGPAFCRMNLNGVRRWIESASTPGPASGAA